MLLSIIIPCYNEEARLAPTLDKVRRYLDSRGIAGEIIVVDDGSADGTKALVEGMKDIKLISFEHNRGKGAAVREGLLNASGDQILYIDADLSTPIEEADKLIALLRDYDVAIGSRQVRGNHIEKYQPPVRLLLGIAFGFTVRLAFKLSFHDTQCGFKAMTAHAAKTLVKHMRINGFTFDVEMLAIAERLGFRVAEVGIIWRDMKGSKLHPARDFKKIIKELMEIRENLKEFQP